MRQMAKPAGYLGPIVAAVRILRRFRDRWKWPLQMLMACILLIGLVWAWSNLDLNVSHLSGSALAVLVLVAVPTAVAHNAWNMIELGRAFDVKIEAKTALRAASWSQIAELLPIPGGAIVRTSLLVQNGVKLARSAELVTLQALIWTSFGLLGGGIALLGNSVAAGGLIASGAFAIVALAILVWKRFCVQTAARALGLRLIGMALFALRMKCAFAVIGIILPVSAAFGFAAAAIAGSSVSIAPGGLGLSEGIAALLAAQIGVSAAAAFIAVALSRLAGLALNMLIVVLLPSEALPEAMQCGRSNPRIDRQ